MPATVTLATTTLAAAVSATDNRVKLASTTGVVPGIRLWIERELMAVVSADVSPWFIVSRGKDATAAVPHSSAVTVTIGSAEQFYSTDPVGRPPDEIAVSPWINTRNGNMWFAQGDAFGGFGVPTTRRWWQQVSTTYGVGPLGVRTVTTDPTSST